MITEYKKFENREVVSFDFDGVMHLSMIPGTLDPLGFFNFDDWIPNHEMHILLKKEKKRNKVIITSARDEDNIEPVKSFLKKYNLSVDAIVLTNDKPKRPYLLDNKVIRHYDDNINLVNDLKGTGIQFMYVNKDTVKKYLL